MTANQIDSSISMGIGLFFTLVGFEIIRIGTKPDSLEVAKLAKWNKIQTFYRYGGICIFGFGLVRFLTEP